MQTVGKFSLENEIFMLWHYQQKISNRRLYFRTFIKESCLCPKDILNILRIIEYLFAIRLNNSRSEFESAPKPLHPILVSISTRLLSLIFISSFNNENIINSSQE